MQARPSVRPQNGTSSSSAIGVTFGAILPFVIAPIGYLVTTRVGFLTLQQGSVNWFGEITMGYTTLAAGFCIEIAVYYLLWKYVVNFFNATLGIA